MLGFTRLFGSYTRPAEQCELWINGDRFNIVRKAPQHVNTLLLGQSRMDDLSGKCPTCVQSRGKTTKTEESRSWYSSSSCSLLQTNPSFERLTNDSQWTNSMCICICKRSKEESRSRSPRFLLCNDTPNLLNGHREDRSRREGWRKNETNSQHHRVSTIWLIVLAVSVYLSQAPWTDREDTTLYKPSRKPNDPTIELSV